MQMSDFTVEELKMKIPSKKECFEVGKGQTTLKQRGPLPYNFITISTDVKFIGGFAFADWRNLKYIFIPDSVTNIGNYSFTNCYNLQFVRMSTNVKEIPQDCFYNCINLKSIENFEHVEVIGFRAFQACKNLDLSLDTVKEIHYNFFRNNAFRKCSKEMQEKYKDWKEMQTMRNFCLSD